MAIDCIRTFMLLPIKRSTKKVLKRVLSELSFKFGGATMINKGIPLILRVLGVWLNCKIEKMVTDKHILLIVDIEPTRVADVAEYLSRLKRKCERDLHENEIYMTYQPITRVA